MKTMKFGLAALTLAILPLAAGCTAVEDENPDTATKDDGTLTLAAALGADESLGTLRGALAETELSGVLEGPASYTLLAPNDTAFEAMGDQGSALMTEEQRPMLVAVLRDHLLPGHLTPEAIGEAIDKKGGPVTMGTLGDTEVTFARSGETITATMGDGSPAGFSGTAIAANNGVVIPIDGVPLPPKG